MLEDLSGSGLVRTQDISSIPSDPRWVAGRRGVTVEDRGAETRVFEVFMGLGIDADYVAHTRSRLTKQPCGLKLGSRDVLIVTVSPI